MLLVEIVGIPKEVKSGEKRVALTPEGVRQLTRGGIRVLVETHAGRLSGYRDEDYERAGALVVSTPARLWKGATFIKKVKEPQAQEFRFFQPKHTLFTFLHLASEANRTLLGEFARSGLTAIAYEAVREGGEAVVLGAMSEIAGTIAAYFAGLLRHMVEVREGEIRYHSWYSKVLNQCIRGFPEPLSGCDPGQVLILGGGHVGRKAAEMTIRMGGRATLVEANLERRESLVREFLEKKWHVDVISPGEKWYPHLEKADAVIGAVYVAGQKAPLLVTREMLEQASLDKKKVIVDVSVDEGGNIFGSKATTYENPVFVDAYGNLRFGVANIPSLVGGIASRALEHVTLDYSVALAEDIGKAMMKYPSLKQALQIEKGKPVNDAALFAKLAAGSEGGHR